MVDLDHGFDKGHRFDHKDFEEHAHLEHPHITDFHIPHPNPESHYPESHMPVSHYPSVSHFEDLSQHGPAVISKDHHLESPHFLDRHYEQMPRLEYHGHDHHESHHTS